ncbi:SulP family inorganic anion transporter [Candidatus Uabimicrobium sp. HlEnr_7]|uniref:SulP family inorganic anion transporter n=1 Tax=Candidatus Uabimicrobium helgolandensis TaxID=3095367 RepID=UPI0035563AC6
MDHVSPKDGIAGLFENWRNDLIASIGVVLVALPLGLGIALASNVPPMAGVTAAIIGGIVTTFIRSSHLAINGPTAGLIVVVISAMEVLGDFRYVLAAIVCAGVLQMLFGLLRLGKFGDFFPSSVIHGLLAAIGIIIFAKQAHVALGTTAESHSYIDILLEIPHSIITLNPFPTLIAVLSLAILIIHPRVKNKLVHFLPAPIFVLFISISLAYVFHFFENHTLTFLSKVYEIGPHLLVSIPEDITDSILFPNFGKMGEIEFWTIVVSIALVASIESLLSTAAIDKLDPFKRKTNLNRDLFAVGLSTCVSGCLGGLPIITVIVRSSVNINNGAKTRWANFYHGAILLVLVFMFAGLISQIPLAALAAILVFTGYRLASPKVMSDIYSKGPEQFLIFAVTIVITLKMGLLQGIFAGIVANLIIHMISVNMPPKLFLKFLFKPVMTVIEEKEKQHHLKIEGVANFFNILHLMKKLNAIPRGEEIDVDFTHTNLVDLTTQEYLHDYAEKYRKQNGIFHVIGLDIHQSFSDYPHSLRIHRPLNKIYSPTRRQEELEEMCTKHNWDFDARLRWGITTNLEAFHFFDIRPVEYYNNKIHGSYEDLKIKWEISDITFDEGALLGRQVYRTTVQVVKLPRSLPVFCLEREEFFDRFLGITGYEEVDFKIFTDISHKFVVKGINSEEIHSFFTKEIVEFFESQEIYHLESNGQDLLVFKYLRVASPKSIEDMVLYSDRFVHLIS